MKPAPGTLPFPRGLVLWLGLSCAGFWCAEPPPPMPPEAPEAQAVQERKVEQIEADVEDWQQEHGDKTIPWSEARGHMAILIDDVGRELRDFEGLLALRYPLSFSVLPGSAYASGVQDRLREDRRRPREIFLHLPMEPLDAEAMQRGKESEETFLRLADSPELLHQKLAAALKSVPHAVGINNHMGSALSADARAMEALMPALAERELIFVDSRTNPETQAARAAIEAGVPTRSRDVFLDHDPERAALEARFEEAFERSQQAPILLIAHPSPDTVAVLKAGLERAYEAGVGVYSVSQLMKYEAKNAQNRAEEGTSGL